MHCVIETARLTLREITEDDAEFILKLLNTSSFIRFIGDRGVRSVKQATEFIENCYRQSYREHRYGLYMVELKAVYALANVQASAKMRASAPIQIGICGFVKRNTLPEPDLGFAFLPEYEKHGYGFESASAAISYGREVFGFGRILAITTPDNNRSEALLEKLGFKFERTLNERHDETLKLFSLEI